MLMIEGVTEKFTDPSAVRPTAEDSLALHLFSNGAEMIRAQHEASGDHPLWFRKVDEAGEPARIGFFPVDRVIIVDIPHQQLRHSIAPIRGEGVVRVDRSPAEAGSNPFTMGFIGADEVRRWFMWLTDAEKV